MQPSSIPSDPLAGIEQHLLRLEQMLEQHSIALAQLRDELAEANRRTDWYNIQFSEMLRIVTRDMHELRATMICSVVSDGPVSAQAIQTLLRETPGDVRELELPAPVRAMRRAPARTGSTPT